MVINRSTYSFIIIAELWQDYRDEPNSICVFCDMKMMQKYGANGVDQSTIILDVFDVAACCSLLQKWKMLKCER